MDVSIEVTLTVPGEALTVSTTNFTPEIAAWLARHERRAYRGTKPRSRRNAIYERDGWICQLCLGPVNRRLGAAHPHAASLDHRIPQAHGGGHEASNLQLAHAVCNHVRGDLPLELVDAAAFAAVRDGVLDWLKAQERYRTAAQRRERARRRWERWVRRARQGNRSGGLAPTSIAIDMSLNHAQAA